MVSYIGYYVSGKYRTMAIVEYPSVYASINDGDCGPKGMGENAGTMKSGVRFIVSNQHHHAIVVEVEMAESGQFILPVGIDEPNFPVFKFSIQIVKILVIIMRTFINFNNLISMAIA